jgi:Arc/MetJ-type ribon-helix-helix transcriptional regulator
MGKQTFVKRKRMGRPSTGKTAFVALRLTPEQARQLDTWAKARAIASRSEAIRRLIEQSTEPPTTRKDGLPRRRGESQEVEQVEPSNLEPPRSPKDTKGRRK